MRGSWVSLGLLTFCLACGGKEEAAPREPLPVQGVQVEVVQPSAFPEEYEALGTVRSRATSVLSSKVIGNVVSVHVREGQRVGPGQLLVEIDSRDTRTGLDKAQAGLREAQGALEEAEGGILAAGSSSVAAEANRDLAASTYRRYQALLERKSVSRQEFDEAEARYKAAEAEVARAGAFREALVARKRQALGKIDQATADLAHAELTVGYSRITAPVAGVVTAKSAQVGDQAAPGVPLITLEDDTRYRLEVSVDDSGIGAVRVGAPVRVRIDAWGEATVDGRVDEVGAVSDPATRTYLAKISIPLGQGRALRSGLSGRAFFPLGQRKGIAVPQAAVVQRGELTGVYAVDESHIARLRLIRTGKRYGDRWEVLAGLNPGDRIVVGGVERVADGSRVQ